MNTSFRIIGLLSIIIVLTVSCAPLKITDKSSELAVVVSTKNTIGKYEFVLAKKGNTPVEITEVALLHPADKSRINLSFSVLDSTKKTKLLTLVDETAFILSCKTPAEELLKVYTLAEIAYKIGPEGKRKTLRIKNIEPPK